MKSIYFIYFDLRKYSYIDKNFSKERQFELLSEMHVLIENEMSKINGKLYQLQLDTAVYYISEKEKSHILETLLIIKNKIDNHFQKMNIPSILHISCAFGDSYFGKIKLSNNEIFNISGSVANFLQQTISAVESESGKLLFNSICFHERAAKEIGPENFSGFTTIHKIDFFYI